MPITSKIYNSNCLDAIKEISSQTVDLILTDPPYNLGLFMKDRETNLKAMRPNFFGSAGWDDLDEPSWKKSMDSFFKEAARVCKKGAAMVVFMAIIKVETIIELAAKHGFYYKTTGIWHKKNPMPRNMNLHFINSTETWIYFVYDAHTGTFNNAGKAVHDFVETSLTPKSERNIGAHPTQKPILLMEWLISLLSNKGDVVLDPFMGSGSTGVAAERLGRNFIGIELNEDYFNIANGRLKHVSNE